MTPSDVKIVAENINDFIEVPDGINRLRKAVLTLAVSGKLVSQDKNEGDANDILFSENSKKKSQPIDQLPFNVPQTWQWVRLGDIGNTQTGSTPKQSGNRFAGGTIPFVRPDNIKSLSISETKDKLSVEDISNGGTLMQKKSLLMVCIGSIGKVGVAYQDVSFNQQINAIHPHDKVHIEYLLYCTASGYFQEFAWKLSSKTTLPILNKSKWESIPVPIPPYKEQERIVEKVKEVLKKLSELESQKNERDLVRSRLTRSAMQALGSADSKVAFDQLSELIKTPQDINELEGAILSLAISGKITSVSYDQYLSSLNNTTEGPFKIPLSWQWKTLEDICVRITDGSHNPPKETVAGGYFMLSSKNIGNGFINTVGAREISKSDFEKEDKRTDVQHNDVLLTIVGTIGRCSVVKKDLPHRITLQRSVAVLKPTVDIDPNYLVLCLLSPVTNIYLNLEAKGTAQKGIYLNQLKIVPIPVPPLGEQKRIVKKVEELMVLVSHLKKVVL